MALGPAGRRAPLLGTWLPVRQGSAAGGLTKLGPSSRRGLPVQISYQQGPAKESQGQPLRQARPTARQEDDDLSCYYISAVGSSTGVAESTLRLPISCPNNRYHFTCHDQPPRLRNHRPSTGAHALVPLSSSCSSGLGVQHPSLVWQPRQTLGISSRHFGSLLRRSSGTSLREAPASSSNRTAHSMLSSAA